MGDGGLRHRFQLDPHLLAGFTHRLPSSGSGSPKDVDPEPVFGTVQSLLVSRGCRLQSSSLNKGKQQLVFLLHVPAGIDLGQLKSDLRAILPEADDARIDFEVV